MVVCALLWLTTDADHVKAAGAWKGARDPRGSVETHVTARGTEVPVTASGLAAGEGWTLRLGGEVMATAKVTAKATATVTGTVAHTLVVPRTVAEGVLPLTSTSGDTDRVGTGVLDVIEPKPLPVRVESDSLPEKGARTLSGTGLLPAEPVTVTYQGTTIAQGEADAEGRFTLPFDVGTTKGEQSVTVVGGAPSRTGAATFTVTGKGAPSDPTGPTEL